MMSCQNCNSWNLTTLEYGDNSGHGRLVGCEACKAVFIQTIEEVISTPTKERWSQENYKLEEYLEKQKQN